MATKKAAKKSATAKKSAPGSMPREGRNPQGGLTQKGREFFNQRDGSHLKPGVTGPADTPEKMLRKGSFLVRTFTHPRGPMVDPKGQPTRLALSAHAWGEKVPSSMSQAHTLAAKGHQLLSKYHAAQEKAQAEGKVAPKKAAGTKASAEGTVKTAGKRGSGK